ncbi:MAG: hypothetical protein QQW96_04020 [Tychonema bourrellyi B0820]|nr:hypothetical protein [Tychonema bourrellyi B0820]PJE45193.1 MAG: hypothetical protein CUR32_00925 [Flavobacterium sp.] [Flavobacterium sp. FEMGT703F]
MFYVIIDEKYVTYESGKLSFTNSPLDAAMFSNADDKELAALKIQYPQLRTIWVSSEMSPDYDSYWEARTQGLID